MNDLAGKTAIVTGASKGIGRAISMALADAGADLIVAARSMKLLEGLADDIRRLGRRAHTVTVDVRDEQSVEQLIKRVKAEFGKIDVLVNNAGIGRFAKVVEMTTTDFDAMFATNIRGTFLCTKAAVPTMIEQQYGDIINIASLAGRNAFIGGAGYAASKWAMIGFARSLLLEVRQHNIRVITICPGSVATEFDPRTSVLKSNEHIPKAEDIARIVVDALRMPRNVMVSEIDVRPTNPDWKS